MGRILELGSNRKIIALRGKGTIVKNLRGRVVLPGFTDSHIHLQNYGMLLQTLDLTSSRSISDIKKQISLASSGIGKEKWITGRGWDDEKLDERRYPDLNDLDQAASNPVFLKRVCGHAAVANSKALSIAGITRATEDPEGGLLVRDSNGSPTGILKENAIDLVERVVPQSADETSKALLVASRKLARIGITSVHCIVGDLHELSTLRRLKRDRRFLQSIYAIVPLKLFDDLISAGQATETGAGDFRIGGVKLFLDGSLGARTAALKLPYNDNPESSGLLTMDKWEIEEIARKAKESGFQLCMHAIGDKAVELAISVLEETFAPRECREMRHRIEHASITSKSSIRKMRRLGIVASVQPRFILSDSWAAKRLGSNRLRDLYPLATFNRNQIVVAAGSDCPVEDPNPFEGVWSAIKRPGLNSREALSVQQALASYTANAAYASFSEDERGSLEPGKAADMVIIDRDPFDSDLDSLRETEVIETIIGGKVVA